MTVEYVKGLPTPKNFKSIEDASKYAQDLYSSLSRWNFQIPSVSSSLPWVTPEQYGAKGDGVTDDTAAIQAAITALTDGGVLLFGNYSYKLGTSITVNKAIRILLLGSQIIGPDSGYAFNVTHNDVDIEGSGDANITLTEGCSGGILLNEVMRPRVSNIKMDMNLVQNAIGLHQLGCWYADVRDMWIEKARCHATSEGIRVGAEWFAGDPGPNGTYGGSYVSTYYNCIARVINVQGYNSGGNIAGNTTITFTMMDVERVKISTSSGISFFLPVVQGSGGTMIDLDTVANCTFVAGDIEATGSIIYKCSNSVRGLRSIGNQISGVGNTYLSGNPAASCYFDDDTEFPSLMVGFIKGYSGALQPLEFKNSSWDSRARIGYHYSGGIFQLANNILALSLDPAYGTITSDGVAPSDGESIVIGTKTYTFKTTLTPTEGEVLIGGSAAVALDNLKSAINHTGTPGVDYQCAAPHILVSAGANSDTTQTITARASGSAGNSIASTSASAHLSWVGLTLSGGASSCNLDDVSNSGSLITMSLSGWIGIYYAQAGSNPRELYLSALFDNGGSIIEIPYVFSDNNAALVGGLDIGRLYQTGAGDLRIVKETTTEDSPSFSSIKVSGTQVVGARVVDARLADAPNSGDATTDGIIAALQAIVLAHGLGASS